jgi:hypothetical protein
MTEAILRAFSPHDVSLELEQLVWRAERIVESITEYDAKSIRRAVHRLFRSGVLDRDKTTDSVYVFYRGPGFKRLMRKYDGRTQSGPSARRE